MSKSPEIFVQYTKLTFVNTEDMEDGTVLHILLHENDHNSILTSLIKSDNTLIRIETYDSLKEFSTTAMKELLTLYAKRRIIDTDSSFFIKDDPKVHAYLSKLPYPAIQTVCEDYKTFAAKFKLHQVNSLHLKETTSRRNNANL